MPIEYRIIDGFPRYRAGNDGTIWSRVRAGGWRQLKPQFGGRDYGRVSLWRDGKVHVREVHHLILEAFVGPRPDGMDGLHKDDIKTNNAASNLYWGTPSQNMDDAKRNGTLPLGSKRPRSKLHESDIPGILKQIADGMTIQAVADLRGVNASTISRINSGELYAHVPRTQGVTP